MSGLLGGSKTTVTQGTEVNVTVNPEITNTIINDDSRLQALVDTLATSTCAIAVASITAR